MQAQAVPITESAVTERKRLMALPRPEGVLQANDATVRELYETDTLADLLAEADESKWTIQPPSETLAGIDRDLTGAILAGWLVLAALAVSQMLLLIAIDWVNEDLASLSRQLAQIARDVAPR
jgi:hypothetical protein